MSTFNICPYTPISFLLYAIEEFIAEEKNATQIIEILESLYDNALPNIKRSIFV